MYSILSFDTRTPRLTLWVSAGMAVSADIDLLEPATPQRPASQQLSDQQASARAAAEAFDHVYQNIQGSAEGTNGQLEGYTVWRPRHRPGAPADAAISEAGNEQGPLGRVLSTLGLHRAASGDGPDDLAGSDYTVEQLALASIDVLEAHDAAAHGAHAQAQHAAAHAHGTGAKAARDCADSAAPQPPPSGDDVGSAQVAGPAQVDSAEGGDLLQAAANSVLASTAATATAPPASDGAAAAADTGAGSSGGAGGHIEGLRQRLLAASTVRTVTAAAAAGVAADDGMDSGRDAEDAQEQAIPEPQTRDAAGHTCPVHWFVADDEDMNMRYFVLQVRMRWLLGCTQGRGTLCATEWTSLLPATCMGWYAILQCTRCPKTR